MKFSTFALDVPPLTQTPLFVGLNRSKHAHDARHAFFSLFSMKAIEGPLMFEMDAESLAFCINGNALSEPDLLFV